MTSMEWTIGRKINIVGGVSLFLVLLPYVIYYLLVLLSTVLSISVLWTNLRFVFEWMHFLWFLSPFFGGIGFFCGVIGISKGDTRLGFVILVLGAILTLYTVWYLLELLTPRIGI